MAQEAGFLFATHVNYCFLQPKGEIEQKPLKTEQAEYAEASTITRTAGTSTISQDGAQMTPGRTIVDATGASIRLRGLLLYCPLQLPCAFKAPLGTTPPKFVNNSTSSTTGKRYSR